MGSGEEWSPQLYEIKHRSFCNYMYSEKFEKKCLPLFILRMSYWICTLDDNHDDTSIGAYYVRMSNVTMQRSI